MAGSSSITGNQTITFTDNMSFDGTDRGGAMNADGQLWIGATASNRANDGGHVRLGTITGSGGVVVTNGPGTINIAGTGPATDLHAPRFIVASSTAGTGANFTSIASAIASAQGTGVNSTIFLQPGTYTENVTLVPGINLCAFDCDALTPNVTIVGKLTLTTAGTVSITGIRLQTNSDFFLAVTGSAASVVILRDCYLNCSNNTGISYTSSSASSTVAVFNSRGNIATTGITLFSASGAGTLSIQFSYISNTGSTVTNSTMSAGGLYIYSSGLNVPITTSGTNGLIGVQNSIISTDFGSGTTCITVGGSGLNFIQNSILQSAAATPISVGATLNITTCSIATTNATAAITGAGTVKYAGLAFHSTGSVINATTQTPMVFSNDAVQIKSPGAYPYTTVPQDNVILVDTSAARTIVPLASPVTGQKHVIKDSVGTASSFNITITPSGKNIDGVASKLITTNYGSMTIIYNGTEWSIV